MSSLRADEIAEILWELKSAGKLTTCTDVARRAGFRAGNGGKAVLACMRLVRRDWPHLQWWRILQDGGQLADDAEQVECLEAAGFEIEKKKRQGRRVSFVKSWEEVAMAWEDREEFSFEPEDFDSEDEPE